ncbi:MAG: aconitate hydratase [Acidimicrobiia bacterium]|nr:aconitate hydratase [Acidimicrobiia bacterium]MYC44979.1 aconitate hydratase [Acidimicrobiia bacterium]MYI21032.1 aconitate hydratase [Acidimicrobiia bacterium]
MGRSLARQLIESHLVSGEPLAGSEIALAPDQVFIDDSVGPLIALELEAMGVDRVQVDLAVGYVDHLLLQADERNPADHLMMRSACERYGLWFSRAGNGICHAVHQQSFGRPGACLVGSDSHTCAAGALGMLAIGAGGLAVALVLAGEPLHVTMPEIWGVRLVGRLGAWVSAKDVILEMLRRHGTDGAVGRLIEYHGPGVDGLSVWDRHVIAHMGAELGATTSVFGSDDEVRRYLDRQGRGEDWRRFEAEPDAVHADYDHVTEIDLGAVEPLVALPPSPGNVVPVAEVAGAEIHQAYIGSSANPAFRDLAMAAAVVAGRTVHDRVSFDINPASREALGNLAGAGHIATLVQAGARLHQAGCNGCPGMGQAPAPGRISVRTVPRNFPGRSGTADDRVYLVSPETAAVSALTGVLTDPRTLGSAAPRVDEPDEWLTNHDLLVPPLPAERARRVPLAKGSNHPSLPRFEPLPDRLSLPVLLKMSDDVSTDEILPAGPRAMPLWSNVERMGDFAFEVVDPTYPERARSTGDHAVIGGHNYGQGSSREQAALAPRSLGLRVVVALSYARIHHENLVLFGILPLTFAGLEPYETLEVGHTLVVEDALGLLSDGSGSVLETTTGRRFAVRHDLSERQAEIVRQGGAINAARRTAAPERA